MSNQLEKLKHSIKKEYVNNFELNLMKSSGFIPVDKRQSDFFVILNKENSAGRAEIIQLIKEKYQNLIIIMEKVNKESIDYELQEKRLKFYQKNDFKLTDYLLSDYSGEFELLSLNDKINVNIVESMLSVIDNGNFNFKVLKK